MPQRLEKPLAMTAQPPWPPSGQDAASRWRTEGAGGGYGFAAYRNLLSAAPMGGSISPSEISLRFQSGPLHVAVEPTALPLDQFVETVRKHLRRGGFSCGPAALEQARQMANLVGILDSG